MSRKASSLLLSLSLLFYHHYYYYYYYNHYYYYYYCFCYDYYVYYYADVAEELAELRKREKEQGIQSNWEIDSFMAASALEGKRESIVTEYMLRILGLDVSTLT